jgi:hypothetical protein
MITTNRQALSSERPGMRDESGTNHAGVAAYGVAWTAELGTAWTRLTARPADLTIPDRRFAPEPRPAAKGIPPLVGDVPL